MKVHSRWAVRLAEGKYVGLRRFNYGEGHSDSRKVSVEHARLFTRKIDAQVAAMGYPGCKVVEVLCQAVAAD